MFQPNNLMRSMTKVLATLSLMSITGTFALAQVPAQGPLLNTTGAGVPPNFMVTMDDSGSMAFKHMPETVFAGGTFTTANPVGSNTVRWDPNDSYMFSTNPTGTVPGNISSPFYQVRALRSPDTNTIFYNPEIRYQPWITSVGTRMADSPVAAAYLDPLVQTGVAGTVINLTAYSAPSGTSQWCSYNTINAVSAGTFIIGMRYKIVSTGSTNFTSVGAPNSAVNTDFTATAAGSGSGTARLRNNCDTVANNAANLNHDPGVYFRLGTTTVNAGSFVTGVSYTIVSLGSGTVTSFTSIGASSNTVGVTFTAMGPGTGSGTAKRYNSVTTVSDYTGYSINVGTSFRKVTARTDCSGTVGPTGCTQAQERQNFANWFTYYRNRNLLARGAMMESFSSVGNTLRLGFGRINKGSASVDGVGTAVIESNTTLYGGGGVRPFTVARKAQFYKWLEDLPAAGGTPLPNALDAVGTYYSRQDVQGPYTDDPSVSSNTVANNSSCRRSYQLMMTDGYWNGTAPSVGDQDSTVGPAIVGGSFAFAANTPPFSDGNSNTLADVAMKYWKNDIQPNIANNIQPTSDDPSYWQVMTNYMVGLGVRGTLDPETDLPFLLLPSSNAARKTWGAPSNSSVGDPANIDDLWHAALNTRGAYYSAKDPATLASAVASALIGAQAKINTTAGVATVSSVLQAGNKKYVPTYDPSNWSGDIQGQALGANGQTSGTVWSASSRVPSPFSSRKIYTWDTAPLTSPTIPAAVAFDWSLLSGANQTAMVTGSANLTDYIRGDHSREGTFAQTSKPYRLRKDVNGNPYVLGDFVNSNPVLIKGLFNGSYASLPTGGSSYNAFLTAKAARDAVLFVGANDGMLHAFKDVNTTATASSDGEEIFAFVPRAVYPNLADLADKTYGAAVPHRFYVDGPQQEGDAYVRAPGTTAGTFAASPSWRNYLVGSLGAGGRAVYALDVTSSPSLNATNVRWEISSVNDSDLGYIMAPIEIGVLKNGQWVAIFGNGFSSTAGKAVLFVVDLETAAIKKLVVDAASGNGLGGVGIVRNTKGEIETLYAGDLKGQVWRMDYNNATTPFVVNGGVPFYNAVNGSSQTQPITQPPSIFDHSQGGKIVVFGTGKLFTTADALPASNQTQTIYGVWDKPGDLILPTSFPRPLGSNKLAARAFAAQTSSTVPTFYTLESTPTAGVPVNWTTQRGWRVDLANVMTGGRVIYPTQEVTSQLVLVTAVAPAQSVNVCTGSDGFGADFIFDVEEGVQPTYKTIDTNGDGVVDGSDVYAAGSLTKALGIRAIVRGISTAGNAVPGFCPAGFEPVSIQNATGQLMTCVKCTSCGNSSSSSNRLFDRVQRRIINPPIR
jgi:type IV pilus assembly protein PilY1